MKTKARSKQYGGSTEAVDAYRKAYGTGADRGADAVEAGRRQLLTGGQAATDLAARGRTVLDSAGNIAPVPVSTTGASLLGAYQPGAVAAAQAQQVLDANAQANLGAARSGGALGLRNALNANAYAGVDAAQGLAVQRAQEEERLLAAKVAQENADRAAQTDALALAEQQRLQATQVGAGIAQASNGQAIQAASATGQLGLTSQGQYLNQLSDVERAQLTADMDYERRRQEDQQRKSQNLWGLAGKMFDTSGKAFSGV